ncbi:MAG: flagellar hook-length control protein FliK, partial [Planctomycetota bacterium]|nr:flagellar hook-length control protein FliK [Planctomycetota bacterium]
VLGEEDGDEVAVAGDGPSPVATSVPATLEPEHVSRVTPLPPLVTADPVRAATVPANVQESMAPVTTAVEASLSHADGPAGPTLSKPAREMLPVTEPLPAPTATVAPPTPEPKALPVERFVAPERPVAQIPAPVPSAATAGGAAPGEAGWFEGQGGEAKPGQEKGERFFLLNSTGEPAGSSEPFSKLVPATRLDGQPGSGETPASLFAAHAVPTDRAPTSSSNGSSPMVGSISTLHAEGVRTPTVVRVEEGNPADLGRKIIQQVRRAVRVGQRSVRLTLDPPSLGRVDVDVRAGGEKLEIHFRVESEEVRSAILKSLGELERALDDLGYDTEAVSVDLRDAPGEESDSESFGGRAGDEAESVDPTGPVTLEIEEQHLGAAVDFLG